MVRLVQNFSPGGHAGLDHGPGPIEGSGGMVSEWFDVEIINDAHGTNSACINVRNASQKRVKSEVEHFL